MLVVLLVFCLRLSVPSHSVPTCFMEGKLINHGGFYATRIEEKF